MSILIGLLYVVEVATCLLLALVVMLQKPKEGGLGGLGGGMGEAVFGADAVTVLIKATAVLGTVFLVNTLVLARLTAQAHSSDSISAIEREAAPAANPFQGVPSEAPVAPAAPAPAPAAPAPAPAAPAPAPAAPAPAPAAPAPAPAAPAPVAPAPAPAPVAPAK